MSEEELQLLNKIYSLVRDQISPQEGDVFLRIIKKYTKSA